MNIHRIHTEPRLGKANLTPKVKEPVSTTEASQTQDTFDFGATGDQVAPTRQSVHQASTGLKPIGMDGTLRLLQQIRDSAKPTTPDPEPVTREQPLQAHNEPAFHLPPEQQWNLMQDNHGSLNQVRQTYSGVASHANDANTRRTEIYKDLGDSLTQIWAKTRSIRPGGQSSQGPF